MAIEDIFPNEQLKRARTERGWTQTDLAEKVGTTFETVSRWERGTKIPSPYSRRQLCDVFGKTPEELGLLAAPREASMPATAPRVFITSAYADAEHKFVASLKLALQARGVTVWSSRTVRKQETRDKRNVRRELIHAAQVVLLILSPATQTSHPVHDALRIARHYRRPICAVWINGEHWQEYLPKDCAEPNATIDARQGDEQILRDKIMATLEQMWLTPSELENVGVPEPLWNVPLLSRPLIGREEEVARVSELLQQPQMRLVTLYGTGGIGKTHLALQVATEMRERFADGVCFVSLAAISNPDLVISAIAKVLGIREIGEQTLCEQMQVALKHKQLLLLLDNFEQVQKASPQLAELLAVCSQLKILVTSRAMLHLHGEYAFQVPPLALPDLAQRPEGEALSEYAAVALFVQRAQAIAPNFKVTPENAYDIAEICIHLDGLPLAIELAAARIRSSQPGELLKRLEHSLDWRSGDVDIDERQRTLRNTVAWSYGLLTPEEQCLFRRLSVFAGGCRLETVEAICSGCGDVWDEVESLLDWSLLHSREQERERRLWLLETIRKYAQECLERSGDAEFTRQAHAYHYLALVEEAEPELKGAEQIRWLTRLEQEQENLRAALRWLIEHEEAELALRFCGALWRFWYLRGYWSEGRRWLEAALKVPQKGEPTVARARALYSAGDLAYYQDDYETARPLLEESVMLCRQPGCEGELAISLGILGVLLYMQDDLTAAYPLLEESEKLCRCLNGKWELSYLLPKLAYLAKQRGELKRAAEYAQEGLMLARKLGNKTLVATTLSTLGDTSFRENDLAQGIVYMQESLALARELGDKYLIAIASQNLGYYAALQGDLTLATYAQEGLTLIQELGDRMLITFALHSLGYVTARQGKLAQAKGWYQEGLSLSQEIGFEAQVGWHLLGLAMVASAEEQFLQAARLFGAVETRLEIDVNMNATERAEYKRAVERVRARLDKRAFTIAYSEGHTMIPEEILATPRIPTGPLPRLTYPDDLTRREVEVLCLVAEGLADGEIAKQLVIQPRTVNSHLTSIYSKIAVSSTDTERQVKPRVVAAEYARKYELCDFIGPSPQSTH